jgi:hypothetical protein
MAGGVVVLVAALAVVLNRNGEPATSHPDRGSPSAVESASGGATDPDGAPSTPPLDDEMAIETMTDVERAAGMRPEQVRAAAQYLLEGDWQEHVHPDWSTRIAEWAATAPIVIGDVTIAEDRRTVTADLAMVLGTPTEEVVLRTLAAASVLGDTAFEIRVSVDGAAIEPEVDRDGARVIVRLPAAAEEQGGRILRVTTTYRIPLADEVIDDGGPAGGGLLARSADVTTLGHWLPVPTFDSGPMVPRGDVAAFDAALWSVRVRHPGVLVTGGTETSCPQEPAGCTSVVGIGLRDLSGALLDEGRSVAEVDGEDLDVRGFAPAGSDPAAVTDEAAASAVILTEAFGPLPWRELDVVAVPLGHAGMEFPGMIWLQSSRWASDGGFASYVNAHEVGHQWFHAMVGIGSLSAPFLDESLAQYAAYLVFADLYGQEQAASLASEQFGGRFNRAGRPDEPVCLTLDAFASASSYGAVVYGLGGQLWVDLDQQFGRERVVAMLRTLIDQVGLSSAVGPDEFVAAASASGDVDLEAALAEVLLDDRC